MNDIRVGVVGANPERGWAVRAHLPAIAALDGVTLSAVGTSRPESAARAAEVFGAPHAFSDAGALAAHPDVDLVAVTVKVPHHAELIRAALRAGKHVLSEWPLGLTAGEAADLAAEAERAGVRHVVGLQARMSPAARHARDLIAAGHLGRVAAVTVQIARPKGAGGTVPSWAAYTLDAGTGAGLVEVAGGHALDLVEFLTGPLAAVSADTAVTRERVTVADTGETVTVTSPDQFTLHGRLASGALLSAHLSDARFGPAHARVEISGTDRDLLLTTRPDDDGLRAQIQVGELVLAETCAPGAAWSPVPVPALPEGVPAGLDREAVNVAALYRAVAADLAGGTATAPTFDDAVRVHDVLDAATRSAAAGVQVRLDRAGRPGRRPHG